MVSKNKILIFIFLIIPFLILSGQVGAPLLTHYNDNREMENQSWAICQDKNNVMIFANRRGILTFDGQSWSVIPMPAIPASLGLCKTDSVVYVGAENDYGYLYRNEKGDYNFRSMIGEGANVGLITRVLFTDSTVYFYSEQSISRHDLKTGELKMRLVQKKDKPFTGMFVTPANTFINVSSVGLHRLESDTLFPIVTGYYLENEDVLFSLPYDEKMVLLGLGDGNLFLFDGIKFYQYNIKNDDGYIKQNGLSDGIAISDSLYAFSTVDGGAVVVAKRSKVVRRTINYLRGLPDDEIFAMGTDNNNGLWLSHQYGLTRAELILPVGNFTMYKGLMGNLISSVWHNNKLYVATSEGVFFLDEVKVLANEEILVKKIPVMEKAVEAAPPEISPDLLRKSPEQEVQKSRKSVFSRIFGKKTEAVVQPEKTTEEKPAAVTILPEPKVTAEPQYVRKTVSRLKSVNYVFRKAEGLDEKCKQLVSTNYGILASTNMGLYIIRDNISRPLVKDRYIYFISKISSDNRYYVASSEGYFYVTADASGWRARFPDEDFNQPVYSVVPSAGNTLWAGSDDEVIKITLGEKPSYKRYKIKRGLRYITSFENDTLFVFSSEGISYYDSGPDSLLKYKEGFETRGSRLRYVISQPDAPWIKRGEDWECLGKKVKVSASDRAILKIFDDIVSIVTDDRNMMVIAGDNQIYRISLNSFSGIKSDPDLFIRSIQNDKEIKFALSKDIVIKPSDNFVYFEIVAPAYLKENSIRYQWKIDKLMDDWSPWQTSPRFTTPFNYGTFTIYVRAMDIWGQKSEIISLTYTREAPFTRTRLFYILMVSGVLFLIILFVRFRERQLQKENQILEEKVRERTEEIEAQKEEITSSIEYASRIQLAMLPESTHFSELFPEHFIFFKPRDIVSGDFYWIAEDDTHIFFTVADCTGHGVPGAFMSTLGVSTLNEIITNKKNLHANKILNLLREKVKNSLHQTGKEGEAADGMDVSFCILHKDRRSLEFSGAFNPLFVVHNGEMREYKADRMPIGIYRGEKDSFTNYEINVEPGDSVYLFSDGLTDQFGGPYGAKYKRSALKKRLSEINYLPMEEQKRILEDEFNKWKGQGEQIDDITIIGVRI